MSTGHTALTHRRSLALLVMTKGLSKRPIPIREEIVRVLQANRDAE
jgi:hypothetical protein